MAVEMREFETAGSRSGMDMPPPRPLSRIFVELGRSATGPVTIATVRDALADRSFAALLVFFAAVNMLPFPPGSSLVLGIPLVIISLQMMLGRRTVWLPRMILSKSVTKDRFKKLSDVLAPRLVWLEQVVRPRYWPFSRRQADRWIGTLAFVLSMAVTIPIPFGNWPPAFAIAIIGVALSERDGLVLIAGLCFGLFSLAIIAGVVGTAGALAALYLV